ncbi:hypothetical protein [Desulfovibrio ferrophilus]|uniref:hypothetical protein n=1 Tax=Desulfovibrio ferrophilus TaxID=241368 RepID=UPI000F83435F|nr:hypothetical protein [Desulfovibrio ferrophilus]
MPSSHNPPGDEHGAGLTNELAALRIKPFDSGADLRRVLQRERAPCYRVRFTPRHGEKRLLPGGYLLLKLFC